MENYEDAEMAEKKRVVSIAFERAVRDWKERPENRYADLNLNEVVFATCEFYALAAMKRVAVASPKPTRESMNDRDLRALWHKVECWFGQMRAAETPYDQGYLMGKCNHAFDDVARFIRALSPTDDEASK